jgi:16S rRNA processing protein RimM
MGRVIAPFGVKGWVRLRVFTQEIDALAAYRQIWLDRDGWHAREIAETAAAQKGLLVRFDGVADRGAAEALRGCEIAVERERLPQPSEGEYYWSDLIGLNVAGSAGEPLGKMAGLLETGADGVLVVRGSREHLIPAARIVAVDLPTRLVTVDWALDY